MLHPQWRCHHPVLDLDEELVSNVDANTCDELTRQEWVSRVSKQDKSLFMPCWNPVHVQQSPKLQIAGINQVKKSANSWLKVLVNLEKKLLAATLSPAYSCQLVAHNPSALVTHQIPCLPQR